MNRFTRGVRQIMLALLAVTMIAQPAAAQIDPSVSGLSAADAPRGGEVIRVLQNGSAKAVTVAQLAATGPNVLNRTPNNLPKWRLALAKYFTAAPFRPKLMFVGDSKDVGVGAGTGSDGTYKSVGAAPRSKPAYVAQMLAARGYNVSRQSWLGSAGLPTLAAVNGYDARRVLPADTSFGSFALGGGLISLPGASTNAITFAPDAGVITDTVDVIAYKRSAAGVAALSDGTTSASQSFINATDLAQRVTFSGYARAAGKTYSLTRSSGGSLSPIAVIAYDSTRSEIEILNAGSTGSRTDQWSLTTNAYSPINAIQAYAPDLTIIQLGTNDMNPASGVTAAMFDLNLSSIVAAAKISGDCMIEIPSQMSTASAGSVNYTAFSGVARDVGLRSGCVVVDHGARLGPWTVASANGFTDDGVHESANGYADEARPVVDALIM